jgi:benzoate membrane transport protein
MELLFSLLYVGGRSCANIAGPMTALRSSENTKEKDGRYASTVFNGLLFGGFGLFVGINAYVC